MKIDVLARGWGSPVGAANGMAMAAAYLAHTLVRLGHQVRQLGAYEPGADLVITTIQPTWRRTMAAATAAGAQERLVYWHHAGGVPQGNGCMLAAPPAIEHQPGWSRQVVLPPSSWAVEAGGECTGSDIIVAGAGPAKGGHVALEVARRCPDLRFFVLQGRSSPQDRSPWHALPNAEVAQGVIEPARLLARARAVLSPTRFEVHPLLLVEAAVRGIPVVCTDMPSTRAAACAGAIYVPMQAPASDWVEALLQAVGWCPMALHLPPYAEVVAGELAQLMAPERAAA